MINFELKETIKIGNNLCRCYRSKNKHYFLKSRRKNDDVVYCRVKGYIFLFLFPQEDKVYLFGQNGKKLTEILTGAGFPFYGNLIDVDTIEYVGFSRCLLAFNTDDAIKEFIAKYGLTLDYQGKDIQKLINEHYRRFLR